MDKYVQTSLPEATYELLRRRARQEDRPIKDIVREAVEWYLQQHEGHDPLDNLIGSMDLGGGWSTRKDWRDDAPDDRTPAKGV